MKGSGTMRRNNLKALGLALIAALALSGVAAGGAQAETTVESELKAPALTNLDITNAKSKHGEFGRLTVGNGARYIECATIDFTGAITGSATTVSGTAEFTNCFANGLTTAIVTIKHNGCELSITALKTSTATVMSLCPAGKSIEIYIYENEKAHGEKKHLCTYDIPGAQTISGVKITTTGSGKTHGLAAELTGASKLKEITNTGAGGLAVCGMAVNGKGEATFSAPLNILATDSAKSQVGVTLI